MPAALSLNLAELPGFLESLGDRATGRDFTVPLKRCRVLLAAEAKRCFDEGHDPEGTPWLPLKHPRPNSKGGDRPLRDKGLLMASLTAEGMPGNVSELTATSLVWGSSLEYAAVHQFGHTFPARQRQKPWVFWLGDRKVFTRRLGPITIPARPFLGVTPRLAEKVGLIFADWSAERLVA